jgi:hypothetical protein
MKVMSVGWEGCECSYSCLPKELLKCLPQGAEETSEKPQNSSSPGRVSEDYCQRNKISEYVDIISFLKFICPATPLFATVRVAQLQLSKKPKIF